jgi:TRAP transporter TAXI family solute receptor
VRLRLRHGVVVALLAGASLLARSPASAQEQRFVTIGTGGITGVYYPTGGAICRMVSKDRARHGIRCSVESTGGSVYNIDTMRAGELDMAIVQSDLQHKSFKGAGAEFQDEGPFDGLRAVFSLHAEPFTVVARSEAGIATFDDLKGKRVNVGNPGSGQRSTMEMLMAAKGWTMGDFALASELKSAEQAQALCEDKIDAMVFTVGHPSGSIQEATTSCAARLIPVTGPEVDQLLAQNPYDVKSVIPGGMYPGNDQDVETFGVKATLVARADVAEDIVYEVTKAVFEHLDEFKKLHPAFAALQKEDMVSQALSAPLHPGAAKYYKEAGLM